MHAWSLPVAAAFLTQAAAGTELPQWNIDYAEDVCALHRLGTGKEAALAIKRTPGNGATTINVVKPGLRSLPERRVKTIRLSIDPGGDIAAEAHFLSDGAWNGPMLVLSVHEPRFLDRLSRATSLTVSEAGRPVAHFSLAATARAVAALRACETDGLRLWGIDPVTWNALRAPPKPVVGLPMLVRAEDYPMDAVRARASGKVIVRLTVDPSGRAVKCAWIAKSGHDSLDQQTCAIFLHRARFEPGLDAEGKPVSAPYVTKITWRAAS
jgi:TonB family protein